jgi:hypothetical protein
MHRMRDAAGFLAGALDMLEAEAADFVEAVFPRQNAAGTRIMSMPRRSRKRAAMCRVASSSKAVGELAAGNHMVYIIGIYQYGGGEGRNQALHAWPQSGRPPAQEFRFEGTEVRVSKVGDKGHRAGREETSTLRLARSWMVRIFRSWRTVAIKAPSRR